MSHASLVKKLYPGRFDHMSDKMAAILGYILNQHWTDPEISGLSITSDGGFLAMHKGDIGFNDFLGSAADFRRNLANLTVAAGLTPAETREFNQLVVRKVESWERYGNMMRGRIW